jgi:hypothetical protein
MKTKKTTIERIQLFIAAWKKVAPDAIFAGMTLPQFELAVAPSEALRDEIRGLEQEVKAMKAEREDVDDAAEVLLELVINSVRGTPGFGADSQAYCAFGYVRKSDRKSGMTRKSKNATSAKAA